MGIWLEAGSRFEVERNNGLSNFLQRLTLRGKPSSSLEQKGVELKYSMSREHISYSAHCVNKEIPSLIEFLSERLLCPNLESNIIEEERKNILIQLSNESNKEIAFSSVIDYLHSVAFQGTPLGQSLLGPEKNISSFKKADFEEFIRKHFSAERMTLVVVGGVQHDEVVKIADKAFCQLPSKTQIMKPLPAYYTGSEVRMRDDTMTTAHIAIAFQSPSIKSLDYFPLALAQMIIGNWNRSCIDGYYLSSKLAQHISSQQLAHSFQSFNIAYSDIGLWGIYLLSDKKYELDDLLYLVQQEWVRLCLNITEGELERAKNQLISTIMLNLQSTSLIAQDIGKQILFFGKRYSLPELITIMESINLSTIKRICSEYLYDRCPVISAFGPIESLPDYNRIRSSTLWLRN